MIILNSFPLNQRKTVLYLILLYQFHFIEVCVFLLDFNHQSSRKSTTDCHLDLDILWSSDLDSRTHSTPSTYDLDADGEQGSQLDFPHSHYNSTSFIDIVISTIDGFIYRLEGSSGRTSNGWPVYVDGLVFD
jgi:hypothetical protein